MLNDNWQKLLMRLRAIANNEFNGRREDRPGQSRSAAIIEFKLYFRNGELMGWSKPQRTSLEPCPFDITIFQLEPVPGGWNGVFIALKGQKATGGRSLVIREDGTPAGWLLGEKVLEGVAA